jgi:hypothetical protein
MVETKKKRKCAKCGEKYPEQLVSDPRANLCKSCYNSYCKNTHRKRINTVICRIYEGHQSNARLRGIPINYSQEQFLRWVGKQDRFFELYRIWEESGYPKKLKPCVIRKSPESYDLSNLLVMTYRQTASYKGRKLGKQVKQIDLDGNVIAVYPSLREAEKHVSVTRMAIKHAIKNPHQLSDGYYWRFN